MSKPIWKESPGHDFYDMDPKPDSRCVYCSVTLRGIHEVKMICAWVLVHMRNQQEKERRRVI